MIITQSINQSINKYVIHKERSRNKLGGHVLHKNTVFAFVFYFGLLRSVRRSRYPSRSDTDAAAAPDISHPSLFLSFSTVLFHVSPSRPRLLLISGAQVSAFLEILLGLFLNTCPNDRHLFPRMRTDTGVLPVAWLCSSSLLRWLGQNILSTPVKHVQ